MIRAKDSQTIRSLWKSLVLILLFTGLFVVYLLFKPGNPASVILVDNLIQGLLEGVGLLLTLPLFLQSNYRSEHASELSLPSPALSQTMQRWVPLLLSLGILSYIIGQMLWTYNENIAHLAVLFPSWADAGYLSSYPFVLLAILLLPSRALPTGTRTRIVLDGLMIMVGIVTFCWYFILGPTILQGAVTVIGQIIGMAYPLATLLLIFCLLLLLAYTHDHEIRLVILILSVALFIIVTTDSVYDFLELHNLYRTGMLLDVGWPLGYMLVGLSARVMHLHLGTRRSLSSNCPLAAVPSEQMVDPLLPPPSLWRFLMPYFSVPAVVLLLVFIKYLGGKGPLEEGVYFGAAVLMVLLLLRQIFAIREMISHNRVLRITQEDVNAKNEALRQANGQLDEQARQIERAYEEQRHLNELKDQFLIHINHELYTPLTAVQGYLELLRLHSEHLHNIQETFLERALESTEELLLLVNNVLDATHMSAGVSPRFEEFSVAALVRDVLGQLDPRKASAYDIQVEIPDSLTVWADQKFLRQILRNVVSNALKYAPAQTSVIISATLSEHTEQEPETLPRVCISVQDAGPGIPPEELPNLFGKFVRLKRDLSSSVSGSGLGLYISKRLVEAMEGEIWVESTGIEGEGSRFCLTLLTPSPATSTSPPALNGEVVRQSTD